MVVNFEFLGHDPIENVLTCLHFKMDKVIFFGFHDETEKQGGRIRKFLKNYCGVDSVAFYTLSEENLQSVLKVMRNKVQNEIDSGNKIFFDITGGEWLILVAFGMLSKEFDAPIHMFDVPDDKLIELDEGASYSMTGELPERKIPLNLDMLLSLRGCTINYKLHKEIKNINNSDFAEDAENIYNISKTYPSIWNSFSELMRTVLTPYEDTLHVKRKTETVRKNLSAGSNKLKTMNKLTEILNKLFKVGVIANYIADEENIEFDFKNESIKNIIRDGGSVLELHTCRKYAAVSDDCRVGVHVDWDGIIHEKTGDDVLNEIDVLALKGNVPTFISCKSGKMGSNQTLHALYELDTVAKRFGGKYAKKVLASVQKPGEVYIERAKEMNIELLYLKAEK